VRRSFVASVILCLVATMSPAFAHDERDVKFPKEPGNVPKYRTEGPSIVVCKKDSLQRTARFSPKLKSYNRALAEKCRYSSIQSAVNHVERKGTRILVMPGVYTEKKFAGEPTGSCADLDESEPLSYNQQVRCPNNQNLIAIMGDSDDKDRVCDLPVCKLQIEGTGESADDVVIDGAWKKLNVIRADRADGVYFRNFTIQRSTFNNIYVIEMDGFVIDRIISRWSDEYGFLTFASDHGVYKNCETYGTGDSGIYPGASTPHYGERFSVEVKNCKSHHNLLGFSGTAGNSVYVHDSEFYNNTAGISIDSAFPDHPGLPQGWSTFEDNKIYSNNENYYEYERDGTCDKPIEEQGWEEGVVCPATRFPVGTGIQIVGGNHNVVTGNYIYDNWRQGTWQFWVPSYIRGENDLDKLYDTSNFNTYEGNHMGVSPDGEVLPNGVDFWWDEEGEGNCWENNIAAPGRDITSDPVTLPVCDPPMPFSEGNTGKQTELFSCYQQVQQSADPPNCDWLETPPQPTSWLVP
jgi:hypothetical protein